MKKILLILFMSGICFLQVFAQSASATWPLVADTSAIVTGNIEASVQILTDAMSVRDYTGGLVGGPAERIWRSNLNWPTETQENPNRYIQYYINPRRNYRLIVQSIALNIGCSGTESHMFANIYYSTDSTFSTRIRLNPSTINLPDIRYSPLMPLSYSVNVTVNEGGRFYLRVYPWYAYNPSPTKYVCLTNVNISGNTVALGIPTVSVFPDSLDFGNVKVSNAKVLTYTLSGSFLSPESGEINIYAPAGFEVSTNMVSGYTTSLNISYTSGMLSDTTIYVKFSPASVSQYYDTIKNSGGGAMDCNLIVKGNGLSGDTILGIFVAPNGNDSNPGTYYEPFATIAKAVSVAKAGDTIFVRGGTYSLNTKISITKSGTSVNRYYLFAYQNESPLLDFSSQPLGTRGIELSGSYWHIKGLRVYNAGDNGMFISGSNNIIELCEFFENRDSGLQLGNGASYNRIINCDSYYNFNPPDGANADGFAPKLTVGTGNYFYGCRAWQNSDDGWDGYLRPADNVTTTIENCWCFMNGYLKNGTASAGNGNGFKLGGGDSSNRDSLRHNMVLKNCLAFDNRVKGFDQNNNRGSMTLYNCTGYRNGTYNYSFPGYIRVGETLTIKNSISFASSGVTISSVLNPILATNSWPDTPPYITSATSADFISLDTTGIRGPRKPDGSLPDVDFMHLAVGSQFIDAGTEVGLPFNGLKPDLGCFETNYPQYVQTEHTGGISGYKLYQNYPNPFNSATLIRFRAGKTGIARLKVVNVLGQEISVLFNGPVEVGSLYTVQFTGELLTSGVYFSVLESGCDRQVKKMLLLK